ncbi:MAG: 50S ribosomal protein L21 [Fusobacteriota bacterium]
MYAIVKTGGKQYKVEEGCTVKVEKLSYDVDAEVILDEILLISKDGDLKVGTPFVEGAKIKSTVVEHGKNKKVISYKYKPKKSTHTKKGHRQPYTVIKIDKIEA